MKSKYTKNIIIFIGTILGLGFCGFLFSALIGPTSDPEARNNQVIQIDPEITENKINSEPKITNTSIVLPTLINTRIYPTVPTHTPGPSSTPRSSSTAVIYKSPTTKYIYVNPNENSSCVCGFDYDCGSFRTHNAAQTCFNSCGGSSSYNWSRLDADGDGIACESLP